MPARTDEGPGRLKRADRLVGEAMAFEGVVHEQQEDVTFVRSPSNRVSPTQTNGKAEAFNKKILQREWAYLRPYTSESERLAALQPFLDDYNYERPHTAIGNLPPASRL